MIRHTESVLDKPEQTSRYSVSERLNFSAFFGLLKFFNHLTTNSIPVQKIFYNHNIFALILSFFQILQHYSM